MSDSLSEGLGWDASLTRTPRYPYAASRHFQSPWCESLGSSQICIYRRSTSPSSQTCRLLVLSMSVVTTEPSETFAPFSILRQLHARDSLHLRPSQGWLQEDLLHVLGLPFRVTLLFRALAPTSQTLARARILVYFTCGVPW